MRKKYFLFLFCSFISFFTHAQLAETKDQHRIGEYFALLDKAFMQKDTLTLNKLLHSDLTLGHSNGWIENKKDLLKTLIENGVEYHSIELVGEPEITYSFDDLLSTRRNINVAGIVNKTYFEVQLNVLEIWVCEKGDWQLLARQSVNRRI